MILSTGTFLFSSRPQVTQDFLLLSSRKDFPGGSVVKNPPANAGDVSSIPASGRALGEGKGNALQYSCLGNTMDKGAWRATVLGVTKVRHDLVSKPPPYIYTHIYICKIKISVLRLVHLGYSLVVELLTAD